MRVTAIVGVEQQIHRLCHVINVKKMHHASHEEVVLQVGIQTDMVRWCRSSSSSNDAVCALLLLYKYSIPGFEGCFV